MKTLLVMEDTEWMDSHICAFKMSQSAHFIVNKHKSNKDFNHIVLSKFTKTFWEPKIFIYMPVKKDAVHEVWMFILVGFTKLCQKNFQAKT